jgi:hypothetical protein
MYIDKVELNETVEEFGWMVQATVVSSESTAKVIGVLTVAFRVELFPPPKYAYPKVR